MILKENQELQTKLFHSFDLVGSSQNITKINEQIKKLALTDSRIFINGLLDPEKNLSLEKFINNPKDAMVLYNSEWCFIRCKKI